MSDTRTFLLNLAEENGIPESRIIPIIEKLTEEWYDTIDSLKELSDSQWSGLNIPGRLIDLIKKKLNITQVSAQPNLDDLIESLNSSSSSNLKQCIETIITILSNILKSDDPKFRKINKSNQNFHNKVGQFDKAIQYLISLGFEDSSQFLIFKTESKNLISSELSKLNSVNESIPSVQFDPYKAVITSNNSDNLKIHVRENDPIAITNEIKNLIQSECGPVNRNAQILRIDKNSNAVQIISSDFDSVEKDDERAQLANIQSVMRQREEFSTFRSKRKNELTKVKNNSHQKVTIKVKFPDMFILQGDFSVKETTSDLYSFVREKLAQQREFYLYEIPLKKTIKDGKHELRPLAPASILYFAWVGLEETTESHGPFLMT